MSNLPQFPSHPGCTDCEANTQALSPGTPTLYLPESLPPTPTTPALVIIGQNPGREEDLANEPFVGRSGKIVREALIPGGSLHLLASIYLTNAVRCHTLDNTKPKEKYCKACFPHTALDLQAIASLHHSAPHILFLLGATAISTAHKHLLPSAPSRNQKQALHTQAQTYPDLGVWTIFSTYHPAASLYNPNLELFIHDHVGLLSAYLTNNYTTPSAPTIVPLRNPN